MILDLLLPHFFFKLIPGTGRGAPEISVMEFEAKSGRDGAWLVTFVIHV